MFLVLIDNKLFEFPNRIEAYTTYNKSGAKKILMKKSESDNFYEVVAHANKKV